MSNVSGPYCLATVVRNVETLDEVVTPLDSFEEVVNHLRTTFNWFADQMADWRAEHDSASEIPVGGFGVKLLNRWNSEVEVGVGRDIWFLFRLKPKPGRCYSDRPPLDGCLAFWLCGWHHTELGREMLISRAACLAALRTWLDSGQFPTDSL